MKNCNSCGKCCIKYGGSQLSASAEEMDHWLFERQDISAYVRDGEIWVDPKTEQQLSVCPWLRKEPGQAQYTCDIYYDRPEDCRVYPMTIDDMVKDECEMLEAKDLLNLKQAKITLSELIAVAADY